MLFSKIKYFWCYIYYLVASKCKCPITQEVHRERERRKKVSPKKHGLNVSRGEPLKQRFLRIYSLTKNIYHPTNKIQCDVCKKDISKHTKILTPSNDYCVGCFSNLEQLPEYYHVINKLDYPLFEAEWTAD